MMNITVSMLAPLLLVIMILNSLSESHDKKSGDQYKLNHDPYQLLGWNSVSTESRIKQVNVYISTERIGIEKKSGWCPQINQPADFKISDQVTISNLVHSLRSTVDADIPNVNKQRGITYHLFLFDNSQSVAHFRVFVLSDTKTAYSFVYPFSRTGSAYYCNKIGTWLDSNRIRKEGGEVPGR